MSERGSSPSFGMLLKDHRAKIGYSQEHLAERAGISAAAVAALEQNLRRAPYRQTIALLARALELSASDTAAFEEAADRARSRALRRQAVPMVPQADNLPTPLGSFVSRAEVPQIATLLRTNRLVTITGPGGVGKTRTAIEIASGQAAKQSDGVRFVDLSSLRDGSVVGAEIASVLQIPFDERDVAIDAVTNAIKARSFLFIVDNCEHLIANVAVILRTVLEECPRVSILATSREPLGLSGEVVCRLPSLNVPEANVRNVERARTYSAVDLFLTRANSADPHFTFTPDRIAEVSEICRKLDGIPLAIELAAPQVPALGLTGLLARLEGRSDLPGSRGLPERHQTMAATIAWSFDLLSEAERILMRRLSAFEGGFTLEAAERVCSGESLRLQAVANLLVGLVHKSLISVVHIRMAAHYRLLETIRDYALERLSESGERHLVMRQHAAWLADFADRFTSDPAGTHIEDELPYIDNSRAAIRWCLSFENEEDAVLAGRIAGGLRRLWTISGRQAELVLWSRAALERIDETKYPRVVARLYVALTASTWGDTMFEAGNRALELLQRIGDDEGIAAVRALLGLELCKRGRFTEAAATIRVALALFTDPGRQTRRTYLALLIHRSWILCAQGDLEPARRDLREVHLSLNKLGGDDDLERGRLIALAEIEFASGNLQLAADLSEDVLARAGEASRGAQVSVCFTNLTCYRLALGELEAAEVAGRHVLENPGTPPFLAVMTIQHLAAVASIWRQAPLAAKLLGFVDAWFLREGYVRSLTETASYRLLIESLATQLSNSEIVRLNGVGADLTLDYARDELLAMSPLSEID